MTAIRMALAGLLVSVGLVLGTAGPAAACSCIAASTSEYVGSADVVLTGTLIDMQDPPRRRIMSTADPITYTVEVLRTFKGDPVTEIEFGSAVSGASCGLEDMEVDRRYTFFLTNVEGGLTASLCGGTRMASRDLEQQVVRVTGPPHVLADDGPPPPVPGGRNDPRVSSTAPPWVWASGGGVAVLVAAGAWHWRRRRRDSTGET